MIDAQCVLLGWPAWSWGAAAGEGGRPQLLLTCSAARWLTRLWMLLKPTPSRATPGCVPTLKTLQAAHIGSQLVGSTCCWGWGAWGVYSQGLYLYVFATSQAVLGVDVNHVGGG